jgi:hypothetical protein
MLINWEAAGAVGEIIGAVAVFATLIYLAGQMRQNNKLLRSQARSVFLQSRETALQALYQNDKLIESMLSANDGRDLTPVAKRRLDIYYRSVFVLWDWEYEQHIDGLLIESPVTRFRSTMQYYPLIEESWPDHRQTLSPGFVDFFETKVLK